MNTTHIRQVILLPIIVGLIFSMGIDAALLLQGKSETIHLFMNYYNNRPAVEFPGYATGSLMISAIFQLITVILCVISLIKLEFLLNSGAKFLKLGLLAAIVSLAFYGFSVRMISSHQASANLFFYGAFLYFVLWYVERQTGVSNPNCLFNKIKLLPIFFVIFYTMGQPGYNKLFDTDTVMGPYLNMFKDTFLAQLPGGIPPFIYFLGVCEFIVPILLIVSVVKGEFLPERKKLFFDISMFITVATFIMLAFGLKILLNYPGSTNLVFYAIVTLGFYAYANRTVDHKAS